jgi:hypothetical protein
MRPGPGLIVTFHNKFIFCGEWLLARSPTPSWRTAPFGLSAAAYSIYSQLPPAALAIVRFYPLLLRERSKQFYGTSDWLLGVITNRLNPLNCWYDSLMHKNPVPNSWFSFPFPYKLCIPLLVRCHCPPIWPPALPLNVAYMWMVPSKLSLGSPPYTNFIHSM